VDAKEERKRKWHGPERQKHSQAVHGQENWKVQQKRGVAKGISGEYSKC